MSEAYKCDRCGSFYELAADDIRVEYHVSEKALDGEKVEQGYGADLCHECSKQFMDFIEHPKEQAQTEGLCPHKQSWDDCPDCRH